MYYKFPLFLFLLISSLWSFAQEVDCRSLKGQISGIIKDAENGMPLPGATVRLFNTSDSILKQSVVAGSSGEFYFDELKCGLFTISINMLSYSSVKIDSIPLRSGKPEINLPEVAMVKFSSNLEVVIIYAEKPLIENKDGKITFNASESALSNSSATIDLLKQTPLVSVDPDGKILMRGKEVKVLIDDKPVDMDARQLQDLLESMPGSMIEKIEVLTTPPSQFANERGGVINIVTKKGRVGINGRLNLNYGTRGEAGLGASSSYKNKKLSANLNVGLSYNQYQGRSSSVRENFYRDSSSYFTTASFNSSQTVRPNGRLSVDYDVNKLNSLHVTFQFNANNTSGNSGTFFKNINRLQELYRISNRDVTTGTTVLTPSFNFAYTRKSKLAGEVLKITGSLQSTSNNNDRDFYQEFLNPITILPLSDSMQQQLADVRTLNTNFRFNYDRPVQVNKLYLNLSGHILDYRSHNILSTFFMKKPENEFTQSEPLSNDLRFYQSIYGLRAALRYNIKPDFFINIGILEELTETNFDLTKVSGDYENKYGSALPFFNLTRKWTSGYNITASYKRSVQRPGFNQLNPSVDYGDPYNLRFGNPYLKPYYAENFDFIAGYWNKRYTFNISLGYNILSDIYSSIRTLEPDSKTVTTWQNISGRKEYEGNFWTSATVQKKVKLSLNVGYTYNVYSLRDRLERNYQNGGSLLSSLNANYTVNTLMSATGSFTYNSFATPQGKARNRLSMNVGVQQKFLKKTLTVSLQAVDPFTPQHNYTLVSGKGYTVENRSFTRSENYRVAVAWTFKKVLKKRV